MAELQITQVRSLIGSRQDQRATMRSLGLRRIRHTVTQPDRPEIRGMLAKVAHLIEVSYAEAADSPLDLEAGQVPHGVGNPPAGASVADDEAAERAAAAEEALAEPGTVGNLGDLVEHPPTLTSTDAPDTPKSSGSASSSEDAGAAPQEEQE